MKRLLIALASPGAASLALAHEGHGLGAVHWHATDTLGFVALAAIVGAAIWLARRK